MKTFASILFVPPFQMKTGEARCEMRHLPHSFCVVEGETPQEIRDKVVAMIDALLLDPNSGIYPEESIKQEPVVTEHRP